MADRTRRLAIGLIVAVVLLPTWFAAIQPGEHVAEVGIDASQTSIRPLQGLVETPNALTPAQVGVIVWVALLFLVLSLAAVHRFMEGGVRPADREGTVADGGTTAWFETDGRWIASFVGASESADGLSVIVALTVAVVVLSILLIGEFFTLGRTQFFGFYAAGIFFAFAGMVAAYYAWFLPHVTVAEERYHE